MVLKGLFYVRVLGKVWMLEMSAGVGGVSSGVLRSVTLSPCRLLLRWRTIMVNELWQVEIKTHHELQFTAFMAWHRQRH